MRRGSLSGSEDDPDVHSWTSISNFINNTDTISHGNRSENTGTALGFSVSTNGTVYLLSGSVSNPDVYSWTSVSNFISDTDATFHGNRTISSGTSLGFSVTDDGTFYLLSGNDTLPDLHSWSSVSNFLSDTNAISHGTRTTPGGSSLGFSIVIPETNILSFVIFMGLITFYIRFINARNKL